MVERHECCSMVVTSHDVDLDAEVPGLCGRLRAVLYGNQLVLLGSCRSALVDDHRQYLGAGISGRRRTSTNAPGALINVNVAMGCWRLGLDSVNRVDMF